MKTYHYCAVYHEGGNQHWTHGTAQFDVDLMAPGAYTKLCEWIGASMKPPRPAEQLLVQSLTVIADDAEQRRCGI
jgi:hypothetical protein